MQSHNLESHICLKLANALWCKNDIYAQCECGYHTTSFSAVLIASQKIHNRTLLKGLMSSGVVYFDLTNIFSWFFFFILSHFYIFQLFSVTLQCKKNQCWKSGSGTLCYIYSVAIASILFVRVDNYLNKPTLQIWRSSASGSNNAKTLFFVYYSMDFKRQKFLQQALFSLVSLCKNF